jgi:hypothetical protein
LGRDCRRCPLPCCAVWAWSAVVLAKGDDAAWCHERKPMSACRHSRLRRAQRLLLAASASGRLVSLMYPAAVRTAGLRAVRAAPVRHFAHELSPQRSRPPRSACALRRARAPGAGRSCSQHGLTRPHSLPVLPDCVLAWLVARLAPSAAAEVPPFSREQIRNSKMRKNETGKRVCCGVGCAIISRQTQQFFHEFFFFFSRSCTLYTM